MKRLMTLAIALTITSFAFGQASDYKHPLNKKQKDTSEKFSTETVTDAQDYKHVHNKKAVKRVRVRQGSGANSAASHKHPLG